MFRNNRPYIEHHNPGCSSFRRPVVLATLLFLSGFAGAQSAQDDSNAWLKIADAYRLNAESSRVSTRITLFKNNKQTRQRLYTVYLKPGRKSLVLFESSGEKDQKVLMLADKFWLLMPASRRPIRITPMQKLLGEASTGDIATMNWNQDYNAEYAGLEEMDGQPVDHLLLTAVTKGVSYKTIDLFLQPATHKPIRADLFTSSGKLAKTATFVIEERAGREMVTRMILSDEIQKNQVTEVDYLTSEVFELPDKYFNPQYLAKHRKLKFQ